MRGLFVTGTDTGVGKTVLSAAVCAALHAAGERVAACKPVLTGLDEPDDPVWPRDHELLAAATGVAPDAVNALQFGPAVSPHLAAELASATLTVADLAEAARSAGDGAEVLIVEGVGGLLVPFGPDGNVRDLAVELGLPLLIAARPALGTINHTLLTLESARSAGLTVAAVVLLPWPDQPSVMEQSNRETIAALGDVAVHTLPFIQSPTVDALAAAGSVLPIAGWLRC